MHSRVSLSILAVCAVSVAVNAQSTVVVPAGLGLESKYGDAIMATHFRVSPGSDTVSLYSSAGIGLPHGAGLRQIAFRPSAPIALVLDPGVARVTISLGYPASGVVAERLPADADSIVAGGLNAMTQVASTTVALPAFDMRTSARAFSIRVPITPFVYDANRGGLVVRVRSDLISTNLGDSYTIDAVKIDSDATLAQQRGLMSACGGAAGVMISDWRSFVPGGVGAMYVRGNVANQAIAFAGIDRSNVFPIDLGPIGMNECSLWTTPLILMPTKMLRARRGTFARLYLPIPDNAALAGASIRLQSFEFDFFANRAGVVLHSGVEVALGRAGTRAFRVATLERVFDGYFQFATSDEYGPVMQLTY